MKENKFKFHVNYAGDIRLETPKGLIAVSESPYKVSEKFRKMLYETLCKLTINEELVLYVKLE